MDPYPGFCLKKLLTQKSMHGWCMLFCVGGSSKNVVARLQKNSRIVASAVMRIIMIRKVRSFMALTRWTPNFMPK